MCVVKTNGGSNMKNAKCKIIAAGLALTLVLALCACSVVKEDEKKPDDTQAQSVKNDTEEQNEKSDDTKEPLSSATDDVGEPESFPGPDSATLVNPRGDTVDVAKQADGTYIDKDSMIYTFDGVSVWTDKDGHDWDEIAK